MTLEEIIKKQKEHLTKAQIGELIRATERYKQLNSANRASAMRTLSDQYRATRRGLQNTGLAGRKGKLISGREKAARIRANEAYRQYNAGLRQIDNAYAQNRAARMSYQNAQANQLAETERIQAENDKEVARINAEYEAWLRKKKAAEEEYKRRLEEIERLRAQQQEEIAQQQQIRERIEEDRTEQSGVVQGSRIQRLAKDKHPQLETSDYARAAQEQAVQRAVNEYQQTQKVFRQQREADAMYDAMHPGSAITRAPHTDDYVIEQKRVENARQLKGSGASDAEVWFADAYGVSASRYKTVKNENPELIKELTGAIQDLRTKNYDTIINSPGNIYDKHQAREDKAKAESAISKAAVAMGIDDTEMRKLYLMNDTQFDVSYAATAALAAARQKYDSSDAIQDQMMMSGKSGAFNNATRDAETRLAKFEQVRRLRYDTADKTLYYDTYPTDVQTKDAKTVRSFCAINQNTTPYAWANPKNENGENWYQAAQNGWKAENDGNTKYGALVNDWSLVGGRQGMRYQQTGKVMSLLANVMPHFYDLADETGTYSNTFEDTHVKSWAVHNGISTADYYDYVRNSCVKAFYGNNASHEDYEQMDAMLALANLMTDEERARFNELANGSYGAFANEADEYFEYLYKNVLPERFKQYVDEMNGIFTDTTYGKIGQSALSVLTNLGEGITGPIHTLTTNYNDSVSAQLGAMKYTTAQAARESVSKDFSPVGKFFYDTGMSMADSASVAMISGGIGKALQGAGVGVKLATKAGSVLGGSILGGSAFNSAYKEALDRGLSPDKARTIAVGQGFNEMLFESLSLDLLVGQFQKGGILKVSKNRIVNWVVNTLVQGGVEGSEEVFTDIANKLWDDKINGLYSEELTKLREYIGNGMSYEDAKRKVDAEFAEQLGMSFLGGAISGGVMGGGASFMGMLQGHDVAKIGRNLDESAKAEIRAHDFQDAEAKEILTGKLTDEDYGRLAMTRLEEMAQSNPFAAEKAAQSLIDAMARTDVKVDKRNQTLKTGTENSVSFDYDGVTDVKKMSGVQVEALRFAQTLVKSKVGGVNINVANKLFDQNGNEQNGWYDAKTNTVHVSLNGSQSVVYTISHELTHRLKSGNEEAFASMRDAMKSELESLDLTGSDLPGEYENILGDYLVKDGEQRSAWEALIDYEMDRYAKHGITLDRESAEEEVVCRACETMLERSRLISSMISRNVRSAKTIAKFLASIYDDIASLKEEAESRGYVDGSPEKLFIDQYADVEKIANAWANAMKTVSQDTTKKIVKEEGRGGTAFSLKQELRDDGQSLADRSMKYRKAHKAESQHISDEMLEAANKQIHRMAQRMLPFLTLKNKKGMTYLPDEVLGKTRFGNSSYGGTSIENTTICFRTLAYIDFTNEIKKQIGRPLTVSESFLASQMLYQIAKEPQCLYCYVSLDRKAYDEQLLSYIKQRDKVVEGFNKLPLDERQATTKATRNPSKAFGVDIPLYTEFLSKRKDTPQMRTRFAQWIDIANSGSEAITAADLATDERRGLMRNGDDWQETKRTAGKVSLQDQVIDAERYAQSASWAKKMEEYRAYNGDILKIGKRTVNKLNNEYGLRFYSFSEYSPAFIVENMQQIRDAALKGLMGLAYTKKTDFARIFAGTGMNINVSTFGRWGVDADGNRVVVMDSDQGADWTEVQNLRKQYENVGAVFVATDDAMTEWAIKQDWIDVVIPFHIVRTGANVAEFYKWVVHNSEQNDVTAEGKNATIPAAEHGNSYEKYMSLVNERGLTPRFNKWMPENNPNVTADEYMKLVNETRRTLDATNPLQPIYDTREAARSFAAFVHDGGYYGDYYKAKSEQDIKVPVTPEQDILGIGSKTYTEQEGIDRVVADIKAGNKANQVPYGRQDIDEQISRLNKARQVKQHGQKFSIKESDAQYMDLARRYESGDKSVEAELRKAVDAAAKRAGYTIKAWHGTHRFGRTKFTSQYGALFLSSNPDVGQAFSGDQPVRAIAKQANPDTMDIDEAARWYKQNVHWGEFRVATDADFKKDIERLHPLPESVRQKYHLSEEEEAWKDKALKKVESKYSRFLNGEKFYYFEYNGINHDYANSPFADVNDFRNVVRERLVESDNGGGVYEMYISPKNMITVDANGSYYANIPLPWNLFDYATDDEIRRGTVTSDQLARISHNAGYDTLKIKNVFEGGDYGKTAKATDYVVMNPESQAKSADLITKDDSGNIIPLSERFNKKNDDIRYSLKDTVEGESLGKDYLKYLQLGTKVVNQTATEDEIRDFKQRMNALSQDNREAFLDKLREKQIRDDERAKARRRRIRRDITAMLKRGNDRIVQLLSNPTENAHVPVQLAQAVAEYAQRLNELLVADVNYVRDNPPSVEDVKAYIDEHGYNVDANRFVDFYTGRGWLANSGLPMTNWKLNVSSWAKRGAPQNVSGRQMTGAEKIIDALNQSYADEETIAALKAEDPKFDPRGLLPVQYDENGHIVKDETLVKMIRGMDSIIQGKHLSELAEDELRFVLNTMRGVIHTVTEANKVTVQGEQRDVYRESRQMANEVNSATKVFGDKSNKITKFMNRYVIESLGLRRIAKLYSGSNENAVFVKMVDDLNEGALEQERIKQTLRGMFNEVTSKYAKEMDTWYGKNAEWIDTGFGFKITKGMRVSLAMHILNSQNLRNVEKAGLRIPDMNAYRKGSIKEAYTNGKVFRLTKEQAQQIVDNMTEAEKAYFEVAKEFFHKRSGYYINRTSLKLLGYSKAVVKNYFPIQTDDAYRTVKYDDVRQNASVEHPGFLESRKGTANVMYLNDITAVVNRQIDGVAKYAGLAIPMRNWNNIMNAWLFEENEDGEWVRSDDGRAHDVLERRMGYTNGKQGKSRAIIDYVDQFITDLTSPRVRDANENVHVAEFAAKITSNYVKAVLTLNARVALSQLASVPTAAAEIPWKYIVQSFGGNVEGHLNRNASNDLIDQYTPIFAMRRAGTQTEVSEVMKRRGFADKAEQKLPGLLGWITGMDVAATRRLWYACERWVKGETDIPVGSDAFYKEVARRYNRVIQNTQPNFTVLQRSPALRSKSAAARIITMFGTQRMQNAGVFIESLAEVVQTKDKAKRKVAMKKFGRTLSGLITAAIVIGLERALVSALRGRMRPLQDEDKDITVGSVSKYIMGEIGTSLAGSFMYVGELYDFVHGVIGGLADGDSGYETSFALPAAEALSTTIKFFKDKDWQYFEYMRGDHTDHEKWLKTRSFVNELMTVASYVTGLPLANASKTILNGAVPLVQDIVESTKTGELNLYLHQSGKLDSAKTAENYKEWTNLGKKGSVYLAWENRFKDDASNGLAHRAELLFEDRELSADEKAILLRMSNSTKDNPLTSKDGVVYKEDGTVVVDFTNLDRYRASTMLSDKQYEGFLNLVDMGVAEDVASTAFIQYNVQKKQGSGANDRFREWLFSIVKNPEDRAKVDMAVVGNTVRVEGTIGYKENGEVYADYSSKEMFDLYTSGKKQQKSDAIISTTETPEAKAKAFADTDNDYHAKGGIVYNDKDKVVADFTSDEAYRASQMGESHYAKYTDAVKQGMSKENAILAVEKHKEFTNDDDKDNATQYVTWVFNTYKSAKDRAIAGAIYTTKPVTIKDGRTYDENGYIYRDYTSAAWYKLSNRTLSSDGTNKRYEAGKRLEKTGLSVDKTVAIYDALAKYTKKSEWTDYMKKQGLTEEQINIFLWSRGWAK